MGDACDWHKTIFNRVYLADNALSEFIKILAENLHDKALQMIQSCVQICDKLAGLSFDLRDVSRVMGIPY